MLSWRIVAVGLFYCSIRTSATMSQREALFRASSGSTAVPDPMFCSTISDAHLLFEILLVGVHFEPSGKCSLNDAELSSLHQTRNLLIICEEIIPKKLTDVFRLITELSYHSGPLCQADFERIIMTMVYTTQKINSSASVQLREMWGESFVALYKSIKSDLTQIN